MERRDYDTAARDILDNDPDLIEFHRGQLIEVHLSQVTFMDSAGIHNLLALRLRARASRRPVRGPRRLRIVPTRPGTHRPHSHPRVRRNQSQRPPLTRRRLSDEGMLVLSTSAIGVEDGLLCMYVPQLLRAPVLDLRPAEPLGRQGRPPWPRCAPAPPAPPGRCPSTAVTEGRSTSNRWASWLAARRDVVSEGSI